jgi:hypothetical protein
MTSLNCQGTSKRKCYYLYLYSRFSNLPKVMELLSGGVVAQVALSIRKTLLGREGLCNTHCVAFVPALES